MRNESQGTYLRGQQLKAESFASFEMVDAATVTLGVPIAITGAMQINEDNSSSKDSDKGKLPASESLFAVASPIKLANTATLKTKQLWEGTVTLSDDTTFTALVVDRTNPTNPAEAVVFEVEEISPDDRKLIQPGAAFYWILGTETSPAGQRKNVNFVNFRRLPVWSRSSFKQAEERAQQITSLFTQE